MTTTISGTAGVTFPAGGLGNPAGAVVGTTDTQTLTNKTLTTPNIDSAQFATVSGTAPIYPCRAWVNFNGTGTVAIRASGNVTNITDNGAGDYTVNFTTAMTDASFSVSGSQSGVSTGFGVFTLNRNGVSGAEVAPTTSAVRINTCNQLQTASDVTYVNVAVFR